MLVTFKTDYGLYLFRVTGVVPVRCHQKLTFIVTLIIRAV